MNPGSSTSTNMKADRFNEWDMNGLGGLNNHLKAPEGDSVRVKKMRPNERLAFHQLVH
jgi:hypothetical protein